MATLLQRIKHAEHPVSANEQSVQKWFESLFSSLTYNSKKWAPTYEYIERQLSQKALDVVILRYSASEHSPESFPDSDPGGISDYPLPAGMSFDIFSETIAQKAYTYKIPGNMRSQLAGLILQMERRNNTVCISVGIERRSIWDKLYEFRGHIAWAVWGAAIGITIDRIIRRTS